MTENEQALSLAREHRLLCARCDYSLAELAEPVCRECGTRFTLAQLNTRLDRDERQAKPMPVLLALLLAVFGVIIFGAMVGLGTVIRSRLGF